MRASTISYCDSVCMYACMNACMHIMNMHTCTHYEYAYIHTLCAYMHTSYAYIHTLYAYTSLRQDSVRIQKKHVFAWVPPAMNSKNVGLCRTCVVSVQQKNIKKKEKKKTSAWAQGLGSTLNSKTGPQTCKTRADMYVCMYVCMNE